MRYAWIENGVVTNIIVLNDLNAEDFPEAVKMGDLPVAIGDTYTDGKFYRDDKEVLTPMAQAQAEITEYKAALNTLGVNTEEVATDEV